jgi:hypothetical protein
VVVAADRVVDGVDVAARSSRESAGVLVAPRMCWAPMRPITPPRSRIARIVSGVRL